MSEILLTWISSSYWNSKRTSSSFWFRCKSLSCSGRREYVRLWSLAASSSSSFYFIVSSSLARSFTCCAQVIVAPPPPPPPLRVCLCSDWRERSLTFPARHPPNPEIQQRAKSTFGSVENEMNAENIIIIMMMMLTVEQPSEAQDSHSILRWRLSLTLQ